MALPLQTQVKFWLGVLVFFIIFLWLFADILLPFVLGMALAYLLDPLADRLERRGMSRLMATFFVLSAVTVVIILVTLLIVPPLIYQIIDLFSALRPYLPETLQTLFGIKPQEIGSWRYIFDGNQATPAIQNLNLAAIKTFIHDNAGTLKVVLTNILSQGVALLGLITVLVITPVVTCYLLYDWDNLVAKIAHQIPRDHIDTVARLSGEIDRVLSGFVRGQFLVGLILGVFYAIGLTFVDLNFGLIIGLGAGLVSFIPYLGALSGLLASGGVAVVQFWNEPVWILAVVAIFAIGQFVEGNILQPKLVGKAVNLHPVALMFALLAFGSLYGFVGVLLAVPIAAALGVLARYALQIYRESRFYQHSQVNLSVHSPVTEGQD
jgi:predicted PurR-regulated permease PerM